MESLTDLIGCIKCKGCCKFSRQDLDMATIISRDELESMGGLKELPRMSPHKGSTDVFQLEMILSKNGDFLCPFLDEGSHKCNVYDSLPLDCRLWPFLIMRSKDGKRVNLVCAEKRLCPSLAKISPAEFEGHKRQIMKRIREEGIIGQVARSPGLIWDYDPDTFLVAEIPELKKSW
jgi:Fe-S-cluster containining protein